MQGVWEWEERGDVAWEGCGIRGLSAGLGCLEQWALWGVTHLVPLELEEVGLVPLLGLGVGGLSLLQQLLSLGKSGAEARDSLTHGGDAALGGLQALLQLPDTTQH